LSLDILGGACQYLSIFRQSTATCSFFSFQFPDPILPVTDYLLWDLLYLQQYLQVSWKISPFSNSDHLLAAPISNCFNTEKALSVLFCLAVPLTSLLFFFRARAVFGMNPFAVAIFGVLWLGVLGGCLTTIPGIGGTNIGPTPYCVSGPTFRL
jgi:hypothetical protein